jgi:hypothetical protein
VVDGVELPQYTPLDTGSKASIVDRYFAYGTEGTRINAPELNIKYAYSSSDEVTHIVLRGKLDNGIPEGLLWNESVDAVFGAPSGTYGGRGDFKIGTLNTLRPEATGGSVAVGSVDFDSAWVMGGFYTAVVINGIIDYVQGVTVTETNESLRLFSKLYRSTHYPDEATFSEVDGKMQRKNTYIYNTNEFHPWPDPGLCVPPPYNNNQGAPRGGYYILISSKANPRMAFLDVAYPDGSKKRIEIDYNEVELREDVPITSIEFQDPSPALTDAGTYSVEQLDQSDKYSFAVYDVVYDDIVMQLDGTIPRPLYLRPLYEPLDIDPKKTTTNMISKIYARDENGKVLRDDNLVITWEDRLQAINVYYKAGASPPSYTEMTVHADLRKPMLADVFGITCLIKFAQVVTP